MLCFIIHVYDEPRERVCAVVNKLQQLYAFSDIRIIYDGVPSYEIPNVGNWSTDRLKTLEHGGEWTHRFLNHYLETSNADWVIKIDPDTDPLQPIEQLPNGCVIFARTHQARTPLRTYYVPHGGAQGFTRQMAEHIVKKQLMRNPLFKHNKGYNCLQDLMLRDLIAWYQLRLVSRSDFACGEIAKVTSTFSHP